MKYLAILICLYFTGCVIETQDSIQERNHSFVEKPDIHWTRIHAQTLSETQKAQKVNLIDKCYYLEDNEICGTILANLEKECNAGIGLSCGILSVTSRDERGVPRDKRKTLSYIRHGCYFDDELSCMYMRQYYLRENKTKEANMILKHTQEQCEKGGIFACLLLSLVYENDESFAKQREYILPYRKIACDNNFAIACAYMDSKELSKKDYEKYQARACKLGMLAACDAKRESVELNSRTQHERLYRIW